MSPGSLTILGLGPARKEHITIEAMHALRQASRDENPTYALAHARDIVRSLVPALHPKSLDYLYALHGVDRPVAYQDLARMMLRKAFTEGHSVLYVVAGSPLFYNDAVLFIRKAAAEQGHPVRLIHGMSFVDLVLDQVHWTGHNGLQLYSAWNIAFDELTLRLESPTLLCQLGEFSAAGSALDTSKSTQMLQVLQERLLLWYPPDHEVHILFSSGSPDYHSLHESIPLSSLSKRTVPVYSNLWIPGLGGVE
jgi:uncharacterized protein YabN with tetrapyrrole methylase and pyrophosphatase domain